MVLPEGIAMTTTSLKLSEEIKARAVAAARLRGVTPHAFMVDAIRETAELTERRARLVADAAGTRDRARKTHRGYAAEDVHKYVKDLVAGKRPRKPKMKTWRS
jgi:predicted transcriptional regulator